MTAVRKPRWLKDVETLEAGGKSVAAVDRLPGGGYRLLLGPPADLSIAPKAASNEWDVVLPGGAR